MKKSLIFSLLWALPILALSQASPGVDRGVPINRGNGLQGAVPGVSNTGGQFGLSGDPQALKLWDEIKKKVYNKEIIKFSDVKGSPYIKDEFVPARVMYDGKVEKDCFVRVDAYNDEIEFKEYNNRASEIYILLKTPKLSLEINGLSMYYLRYMDEGDVKETYMYKKYEGERYRFYARTKKIIKQKRNATTSLQTSFPARFYDIEEFFIGKGTETLNLVPLKKNKIIEQLDSGDVSKAKRFIKENKLDIRKESELVKLLTYLEKA